ncbi:MAG: glycosyltransferase family A protein [Caldilineaceae bacterium]
MQPLFSVILPTYNRAYVLWKAIQSVIAQSEPRWELIVVNDGSTDCTLRLLEEFRDPRLRVITTANRGPSVARNQGLVVAAAPYVAYLDSDNVWHREFLAVMLESIQRQPQAICWYCNANTTFWERTKEGEWHVIWRKSAQGEPKTREALWRLSGVDTNCMVHRCAAGLAIGGWDEQCRWLEDWDFFLRIFLRYPDQVVHIPYTLVEYRQVHGTGADGICAEAREDFAQEQAGRAYLLAKWGTHPEFAATDKLTKTQADLPLLRASPFPHAPVT